MKLKDTMNTNNHIESNKTELNKAIMNKAIHTLRETSTIRDVMNYINDTGEGAVIITDKNSKFLGVITNGDIRRAILSDFNLSSKVSKVLKNPSSYTISHVWESEEVILEKINEKVQFLPILDKNGHVVDVRKVRIMRTHNNPLDIHQITIPNTDTIRGALDAIERGGLGICLITDRTKKFYGLLTDGDIRRAILSGKKIDSPITQIMPKSQKTITYHTPMQDVIKLFREGYIQLPVIDKENRLIDLITKHVSIILPTFNEKGNINKLISAIFSELSAINVSAEVIVVDDKSEDKTADIVKKEYGLNNNVSLIVRENERGLASAISRGLKEATGRIIILMDTDFNHNPKYLKKMIKLVENNNLVVGSRFVSGGGMKNAMFRWICSYVFNSLVSIFLNLKTKDNQSGFIAIRRENIIALDAKRIFHGYGDYAIRLLYTLRRKKIKEIPVVYGQRRYGESKTRFVKHLLQYTKTVIGIRLGKM